MMRIREEKTEKNKEERERVEEDMIRMTKVWNDRHIKNDNFN